MTTEMTRDQIKSEIARCDCQMISAADIPAMYMARNAIETLRIRLGVAIDDFESEGGKLLPLPDDIEDDDRPDDAPILVRGYRLHHARSLLTSARTCFERALDWGDGDQFQAAIFHAVEGFSVYLEDRNDI